MKKATCLSAAVLQNSAVLLATNNISNSQKWHALGILFSVLCRHTAWLAFVFPEFICISHPGLAVAHLTNDGSTVISRWSDLQRKYSENISYTIVADERNGSGPNSSCLPLHLISRSYGENLPAVNIWFLLAWTVLCVGSATVWICSGFPGCLSRTTANFSVFFYRIQDFVLHLGGGEWLNAIQWRVFHVYNTWVISLLKTAKKPQNVIKEQHVISSSLLPPSSRCNPSASHSLCITCRWLSWQSGFVAVGLSGYTPERMKRWHCWNAVVRARAASPSFPSILLTHFSGNQCPTPVFVHPCSSSALLTGSWLALPKSL